MSLFNDKPTQLSIIQGKIIQSGSCTDVIGGTMTAATFDGNGSSLITWAPAFISAPLACLTVMSGIGGSALTASNYLVMLTGVTVSNAYVASFQGSGITLGLS